MDDQFQGICPICYKPVRAVENFRTIKNDSRSETYHDSCINQYVSDHLPQHVQNQGLSIFAEYVDAVMFNDYKRRLKRVEWVKSNISFWKETGDICKLKREEYGIALKHVAEAMGVSLARLKRFEAGKPVRDAKLLYTGYSSLLYIHHLEQRLRYAGTVIDDQEIRIEHAIGRLRRQSELLINQYTSGGDSVE